MVGQVGHAAFAAASRTEVERVQHHLSAAGINVEAFKNLVYSELDQMLSPKGFKAAPAEIGPKYAVSSASFLEGFEGNTISGPVQIPGGRGGYTRET